MLDGREYGPAQKNAYIGMCCRLHAELVTLVKADDAGTGLMVVVRVGI